ncbi:GIP, partial [Symbiodinium pilosum]
FESSKSTSAHPFGAPGMMMLRIAAFLVSAAGATAPNSDWCAWVPKGALQYVSECNSTVKVADPLSAGCGVWCPWVPQPVWHNITVCQRCEMAKISSEVASPGTSSTGLKVKQAAPAVYPAWCAYVPWASLPKVLPCAGYKDGYGRPVDGYRPDCQGWCQWVPGPSWQFAPGCKGCTAGAADYVPAGLGCASWCEWVPRASWQFTS